MSISHAKQRQAGTIKMESEPGKGSLLTIDFPCFGWQNLVGQLVPAAFCPSTADRYNTIRLVIRFLKFNV